MIHVYVGIDPGLSGAIAIYVPQEASLSMIDVPTLTIPRGGKNKREVDIMKLWKELSSSCSEMYWCCHFWIEKVNAMPGQGVSSSFAFGKVYGILIGMIGALRKESYEFVAPQVWKKALQVPRSKDGARARASQLFPQHAYLWARAKDDGRAEAALIAYYGSLQKR